MKPATAFCRCGAYQARTSQHVLGRHFLEQIQKKGANPPLALKYTRIHLTCYYQPVEIQMD